MKKRLLCLGLVALVTQFFGTGCHICERWRANHPCGTYQHHPLLHPIQTRRAIFGTGHQGGDGSGYGAASVGPVVMNPPCHGCGTSGLPVSYGPMVPGELTPTTYPPTFGQPIPLNPGPKVYPLPSPMEAPKVNGQ